ncbi:MAG: imidazole glycerol phosphate synthase subunit HisH [candidate division Zixibacteria bacterium]|nr:imidazole glycerol phosphate synthase subunit HisH [candidate division Zixibacteria bacterium]
MVELINFGGGNLGSMRRALERLDVSYRVSSGARDLTGDHGMILPGVGAFGAAMAGLKRAGLKQRLNEAVRGGSPYLGICIGMQLLFGASEESPGVAGLGLIDGEVVRFSAGKVPQIGWNRIEPLSGGSRTPGFVYFVNSYHCRPIDETLATYRAEYHIPFCAALRCGNITAFQFHPERSGPFGHRLLKEWCDDL